MTLDAFLTDVARARGAFIDGKHLAQVRVGGTLVQDSVTNLFTNPSFASGGAPVEVFRNRHTNPDVLVDLSGWGHFGGPALLATTRVVQPAGELNITRPGAVAHFAATADGIASAYLGNAIPVTAGETITASFYLRRGAGWTGTASPRIDWSTGTRNTGSAVTISQLTYDRFTITAVAPVGATTARLNVLVTAMTAGNVFRARMAQIVSGSAASAYMDGNGSEAPDADLTAAWEGAVGLSPSVLSGNTIAGVAATGCVAIRSTQWAKEGAYSMRLIPTSPTNNYSYARIPIPAGDVRAAGTMLATLRLAAPLTGSMSAAALSIRARNPDQRVQAPNTAGAHDLRLTFSALTDTYFIELMHGGLAGSGDVWWDLATLVAGNYTGRPASGDSPGWAWDGTPHNSTSHGWR